MAGVLFQQTQQHELQVVARHLAAAGEAAAVAAEAIGIATAVRRAREPVAARAGMAVVMMTVAVGMAMPGMRVMRLVMAMAMLGMAVMVFRMAVLAMGMGPVMMGMAVAPVSAPGLDGAVERGKEMGLAHD
ncbi:hypothetical protein KYC_01654 [Achromobacter arsenitoxydans SY8]|uniref:Uncharacterized protein n=1 Tax=Achromobacter arsenitoxydans SY8 TaxID=477184 RepID=H0F0P9_9BURK|nr:hypothetical protein KYC_01654 [Achromobacter arsenitoxydans SY8]